MSDIKDVSLTNRAPAWKYLHAHKTNLINRQNKHTTYLILTLTFDCFFSTYGSLKKDIQKYPYAWIGYHKSG